MQYAIIENNVIVNIAEADEPLASNWEAVQGPEAIGWSRQSQGLPWAAPAAAAEHAPLTCQRRQGRLVLLRLGYLDDVENHIAGIADPMQRRAAQIEYEADTWHRENPFLMSMWGILGHAPSELIAVFREAAAL